MILGVGCERSSMSIFKIHVSLTIVSFSSTGGVTPETFQVMFIFERIESAGCQS